MKRNEKHGGCLGQERWRRIKEADGSLKLVCQDIASFQTLNVRSLALFRQDSNSPICIGRHCVDKFGDVPVSAPDRGEEIFARHTAQFRFIPIAAGWGTHAAFETGMPLQSLGHPV
jgi:hypothetical protein